MEFRKSNTGSSSKDEFSEVEFEEGKNVRLFTEEREKTLRKTSFTPRDFGLMDITDGRRISMESPNVNKVKFLDEPAEHRVKIISPFLQDQRSLSVGSFSDAESDIESIVSLSTTPTGLQSTEMNEKNDESYDELSDSDLSHLSDDEENENMMNEIFQEFQADLNRNQDMAQENKSELPSNEQIFSYVSDFDSSEDETVVNRHFTFEESKLLGTNTSFSQESPSNRGIRRRAARSGKDKSMQRALRNIARKAKYSVKQNLEYLEVCILMAIWILVVAALFQFSGYHEELKIALAALFGLLAIPCLLAIFIFLRENNQIQLDLKREV